MLSELKSIFEFKSPNPKGMVTEKKGKQETVLGAVGLVHSLLISTTQTMMGIRYEMSWKEAHSTDGDCKSGIKANAASFLL